MTEVWYCVKTLYGSKIDKWNGSFTILEIFNDIKFLPSRYDEETAGSDDDSLEYMQSPLETIHKWGGDYENLNILFATMCENNGMNTLIVSIHDNDYPGNDTVSGELNHFAFFVEKDYYHEDFW